MEKQESKISKIFAFACVSILVLFLLAIGIRTFTRQVLVKKFGMSNAFTEIVLFDVESMKSSSSDIDIDWASIYPFKDDDVSSDTLNVTKNSLDKVISTIDEIKEKINIYVTDFLPGHYKLAELSASYELGVLWNYSPIGEYNNIIRLEDDYLVGLQEKVDVTEAAEATIDFAQYCKEQGAEFAYIHLPVKICPIDDTNLSGITDFHNQNADEFLELLSDAGVTVYDQRTDIHSDGLDHHSLFYKTDHHWKSGTGLWAARHMVDFINNEWNYNLNTEILDDDNFTEVIYPQIFLGSQGKKATIYAADPEDLSLYYPKCETAFHYCIPNLNMDVTGSFEIMYNLSCVSDVDFYGTSPYTTFNYGDRPIIRIENELIDNGPKILIIHKSFSNCEIPFLALSVKNIVCVDLRHFTGSVKSLIEQENPDIVIVTYELISGSIDYSTHTDCFDFR